DGLTQLRTTRPGEKPTYVNYDQGRRPKVLADGSIEMVGGVRPTEPQASEPAASPGWNKTYVVNDANGSVRALIDETGNVTDTYKYSASGELLSHTGSDPQPYAFAGEALDPNTGLQYHRARWMDPRTGRFISPDPLLGESTDPVSFHRYLYASADPVNRVDPAGQQDISLDTTLTALSLSNTINGVSVPNFDSLTQ